MSKLRRKRPNAADRLIVLPYLRRELADRIRQLLAKRGA